MLNRDNDLLVINTFKKVVGIFLVIIKMIRLIDFMVTLQQIWNKLTIIFFLLWSQRQGRKMLQEGKKRKGCRRDKGETLNVIYTSTTAILYRGKHLTVYKALPHALPYPVFTHCKIV